MRFQVDLVESVAGLSLSESDADAELFDGLRCGGELEIAALNKRFLEVDQSRKKSLEAISSLCSRSKLFTDPGRASRNF